MLLTYLLTIHLPWYEAQSCQERYRSALYSTSVPDWTFIREESWLQELNMEDHITKLCQSCYYQLRQIRTVRHSLTSSAIQTLVHAFICTRVDFFNSLLYGTSAYLLDRLQSVLNSAARLILRIGKYDQISVSRFCFAFDTSSTPSRATAWLAVHRSTWSSYATPWLTFQQGATFGRRPRFSSWFFDIGRNDTGEEISPSPHHSCGTYFLPTSDFSTTSINFSGRDSKLTICNISCYATENRCQRMVISEESEPKMNLTRTVPLNLTFDGSHLYWWVDSYRILHSLLRSCSRHACPEKRVALKL